jgi:hypothetical protein
MPPLALALGTGCAPEFDDCASRDTAPVEALFGAGDMLAGGPCCAAGHRLAIAGLTPNAAASSIAILHSTRRRLAGAVRAAKEATPDLVIFTRPISGSFGAAAFDRCPCSER